MYRIRICVGYTLDTYPQSIRIFIIFVNIGYASRYVFARRPRAPIRDEPLSLLAGRARRSVRPRCAGWCAMEGSRRSRGDAPWRGERTEQRRPLLRQDSATGRSPPPSPAADQGPAATDRARRCPAWSRARGGGRVAAVAAAAVSLGVGL